VVERGTADPPSPWTEDDHVGKEGAILLLDEERATYASGLTIDEWGRADKVYTRSVFDKHGLAIAIGRWARSQGYLHRPPDIVSDGGLRWTEYVFGEINPILTVHKPSFNADRLFIDFENHYRRAHGLDLLPDDAVFNPPPR
jgi:hypothetical protein